MALASEDISSLSEPACEPEPAAMPSFHARAALHDGPRNNPMANMAASYDMPDMHDSVDLPRMMGQGINQSLNQQLSQPMGQSLSQTPMQAPMHAMHQPLNQAGSSSLNQGSSMGSNPNHPSLSQDGRDRRFESNPEPWRSGAGSHAHAAGVSSHDNQSEMAEMMQELRAMRGMMETQLAELAWNATQNRTPQKGLILREMLGAGFSPSLARYVTEKLPDVKNEADALRWLKNTLSRNLITMGNEHEILEKGGVFALVGPTGVGKTTSTAKLAARCVMRHGTDKLALITTDGYRIGGHEQLRIYGKILGVMVHSVKDEADLRIALRELRGKHTVLIDTIGVSQRDNMVAEQVAMLSGAGNNVQRLLCLNATSTGETLSEVVRAYTGTGLAGCIMTKLDEAATIGNVLDVIIRAKLNLYYVSNGQRVPEDLHLADRAYLMDRAFKLKRDNAPYQLQDSELPLIVSQLSGMSAHSQREVHLG
jgi:flagellar biosynthesis protein FlhF